MDPQTTVNLSQVFLTSLGFMSILLCMVLIALIRRFRIRLQQYRAELAREVELIDAERRRIHTDLHDELGSGLASISLLAQQVQASHPLPAIDKIYWHTISLRNKIKEIAYNFVPPILETRGLAIAIQDYTEELNANHPVTITCQINMFDQHYAISKSIHVYRLTRELLSNALKHARCSHIQLNATENKRCLTVSISDNGIGFRTSHPLTSHMGSSLSHLQSRVNILKARISIHATPGNGTQIQIIIPLQTLRQ